MKFQNIHGAKGDFFKVLGGTEYSQIAVMTIEPGGDSGFENTHTGDRTHFKTSANPKVRKNRADGRKRERAIAASGERAFAGVYSVFVCRRWRNKPIECT